ncbi:MAG: sodium:proton antiporter [Endozoicomonadaceae bacterium]|nr:sodium:proton antiporter [Endozoicomonadaceae bacterium]
MNNMDPILLILIFVVLSILGGVTIRALLKNTAIPYSVALLVLGLILGLMSQSGYIHGPIEDINRSIQLGAELNSNLILFVFLPALIFESAFDLEVHLFKRMFSQIALLAVPGLVICACLTALLSLWVLPWGWSLPVALMFGAVVSATDPVAVVAMLKEMCPRARLQTLIEGESLLNDGTAIVLFSLFLTFATQLNAEMHIPSVILEFFRVVILGIMVGCLVAVVSLIFINQVFNDSLIEITLTLATPYLVFYMAEHVFHVSGVVAVVTLALIYAGPGRTCFSPEVIDHLHHFWQTLAYLFNTLIFILVGIVIAIRITDDDASVESWILMFVMFFGIMLIRALAVLGLIPFLSRLGVGINKEKAIVLIWGGLRGAVSMALALMVAANDALPLAVRNQILFLTAGIVVLSIVVNGGTMRIVMAKLGLNQFSKAKQKTLEKVKSAIHEDVNELKETLKADSTMQMVNWDKVDDSLSDLSPSTELLNQREQEEETEYLRKLLESERQYYWNQFSQGLLSKKATTLLIRAIEQALDGQPKIAPRPHLEKSWATPKWVGYMESIPLIRRYAQQSLYMQQVLIYESARGLLAANQKTIALAKSLSLSEIDRDVALKEMARNVQLGEEALNKVRSLSPAIVAKIETHTALRILLNKQRNSLTALSHEGVISEVDAEDLVSEVELKMHKAGRSKLR